MMARSCLTQRRRLYLRTSLASHHGAQDLSYRNHEARQGSACSVGAASCRLHGPWTMTSRNYAPRIVYDKPEYVNSELKPYIRTCLSGTDIPNADNSGFHVCFLGTGASIPSKERISCSTLLQLGGQSFIFDAGEGVQRQLVFTSKKPSDIVKIFITHMHADHVLGLPGLLLMIQNSVRSHDKMHQVEVYGPPGIYNYIAASISLTHANISSAKIVVYELVGGEADKHKRQRKEKTNKMWNLEKKSIERNTNGTWTIQRPSSVRSAGDHDVDRGSDRPLFIYAAEIAHLPDVQTFGFVVREPDATPKIDPQKAQKLGVAPSKKYASLKNGIAVMSDDGSRKVHPKEVLVGTSRKARKFAYTGDNYALSPAMRRLCIDCDVLVHEATLSSENASVVLERGHATAEMAGSVAKHVNASVLVLNHISAGLASDSLHNIAKQAEETNGGTSRVLVAYDFLEVVVPRFGYGAETPQDEPVREKGFVAWMKDFLFGRSHK